MNELKVGCIVQLNSETNSLKNRMTVSDIDSDGDVECVWHTRDGSMHCIKVSAEALKQLF